MHRKLAQIENDNRKTFDEVYQSIVSATMVPQESCYNSWSIAVYLIQNNIPGDFAEFGTWKGGCSLGMALIQRQLFGEIVKPIWMFDSFEGLPKAEDRDGEGAINYQRDMSSPKYYDNCRASYDDVRALRDSLNITHNDAPIIRGWFEESLPPQIAVLQHRKLALARVDCDWYKPVRFVLDNVDPLVSPLGVVILDDYYAWDGCARATHDFLSRRSHPYRLRETGNALAAYYVKTP
jgi:O-methyltransferase